jgi:Protein of unknown function (DUF2510)
MARLALYALLLVIVVVIIEVVRRQRFNVRRDVVEDLPAPPSPDGVVRAPAGWYARPDGGAGQQYWDGEVWTEQLRA